MRGGVLTVKKNTKIVLISISLIILLTALFLFIRTPSQNIEEDVVSQHTLEPTDQSIPENKPSPITADEVNDRDESHEKVENLIDQATSIVVDRAPGFWEKVKNTGTWFMEFDTKYALILLGVSVLIFSIVGGEGSRKKNKR